MLWSRQTDPPILGSPAYVNGMIGLSEGSTFEVLNAANGQLLYSYVLPASAYGAISVAYGQFFVPTLGGQLLAFGEGSGDHAAGRPELSRRAHLPGHPRPGQGHRGVLGRHADRDRCGHRGQGHRRPVPVP